MNAPFDRRQFLTTSVTAGFALAVEPVMAAVIHTDSDGIVAGEVKVPVEGGETPAYRAYPAKGGPFPVVLVAHEIFGVHDYIQDVVRRLAKLGYYAICPDLYSRYGDAAKMESTREILDKVVSKVTDASFLADLDSTVAYVGGTGKGDIKRLGITGFCWGGRVTWIYAAHNPKVLAGVAWYGGLAKPRDPNGKSAMELAPSIKGAVLGLYAGQDMGIPFTDVEAMRSIIAGGKSDIVTYPDAQHGFHADYRPSYNEADAKDGWARLTQWFKSNL